MSRPQRYRRSRASGAARHRLEELLARHLDGGEDPPEDMLGYLDYLAGLHRFAFHGSGEGGLRELSTERKSDDARAFGRQQAVYASPDPHWAAFFALANREHASSVDNFSIGLTQWSRTRWYRRDIVMTDPTQPAARPGWLYVLPRDTFHAERRLYGLIDIAHWVSDSPVRPLFALQLSPENYPLARHIRAVSR
ncbi:MAG: hypothetical protein GX555_13730 [Actinomycetales bacterium]|nr:hypothetical protein [Actinomycetales bacterium]